MYDGLNEMGTGSNLDGNKEPTHLNLVRFKKLSDAYLDDPESLGLTDITWLRDHLAAFAEYGEPVLEALGVEIERFAEIEAICQRVGENVSEGVEEVEVWEEEEMPSDFVSARFKDVYARYQADSESLSWKELDWLCDHAQFALDLEDFAEIVYFCERKWSAKGGVVKNEKLSCLVALICEEKFERRILKFVEKFRRSEGSVVDYEGFVDLLNEYGFWLGVDFPGDRAAVVSKNPDPDRFFLEIGARYAGIDLSEVESFRTDIYIRELSGIVEELKGGDYRNFYRFIPMLEFLLPGLRQKTGGTRHTIGKFFDEGGFKNAGGVRITDDFLGMYLGISVVEIEAVHEKLRFVDKGVWSMVHNYFCFGRDELRPVIEKTMDKYWGERSSRAEVCQLFDLIDGSEVDIKIWIGQCRDGDYRNIVKLVKVFYGMPIVRRKQIFPYVRFGTSPEELAQFTEIAEKYVDEDVEVRVR
ncbi:hypothetical protein HOE67_02360 [Candidatus Peregrinibacteria bacterium]|jgi:hypothetical protein|nr:hypothetical protein [Candidatus Peregrinibacteria bacterium]MBT4055932.1 hypothetical protein [Candidatus Peregrinibacteria bacterium]